MTMLKNIQTIIDSKNIIEKFYNERTKRHIELVKKYGMRIKDNFKEFSNIDFDLHDSSKFEEPEYTPYTHITWHYKCKNNGEIILNHIIEQEPFEQLAFKESSSFGSGVILVFICSDFCLRLSPRDRRGGCGLI